MTTRTCSPKPTRLKRLDMAETALDALRVKRGMESGQNTELSVNPDWLELTERFADLTGMTMGRYCRTFDGEEMPEPVLGLMRQMVFILNGRYLGTPVREPVR